MWKIRKFSLQSGLELMATRMIDEVLTKQLKTISLYRVSIRGSVLKVVKGDVTRNAYYGV